MWKEAFEPHLGYFLLSIFSLLKHYIQSPKINEFFSFFRIQVSDFLFSSAAATAILWTRIRLHTVYSACLYMCIRLTFTKRYSQQENGTHAKNANSNENHATVIFIIANRNKCKKKNKIRTKPKKNIK